LRIKAFRFLIKTGQCDRITCTDKETFLSGYKGN